MVGPIRFDGLVSGIDYTSIIEKMLEAQRRPVESAKARIELATAKKNAFLELNVALLVLKQASDTLRRPSFFSAVKASSSDASILTAAGGAGATPGSHIFTVQQLAQSHQLLSGGFADAATTAVATSAGALSIAVGGDAAVSIAVAAGTKLQGIADAINAAGIEVSASVINDGSAGTPFRLSLTSRRSGEAGELTVDASSIPALSFSTTSAAQDAVVLWGSGGGGGLPAELRSSTNTLSGAVPGLTLNLQGASATPVTVTVSRDTQAVVDQAQRFVDGYNQVVGKLKEYTSFDPATFKTGILFGDSAVSRLGRELSALIVAPVSGIPSTELNTLTSVGIRIGAQGALTFDGAAFAGQLESRFEQVESLFTKPRRLELTTPLQALGGGAGLTQGQGADLRILARDGSTIDVDLAGATTLGGVLLAINGAAGNGGKVVAEISPDGFSLQLLDASGGSANPLQVDNLGDALAASQLKIAKTAGPADLLLKGDILTVSGSPGVAARMSDRLGFITQAGEGLIAGQTAGLDKSVEGIQKSIERIEKRVLRLQESLIRKFSALERVIAKSQSAQQRLGQLLSSLTSQGNGSF